MILTVVVVGGLGLNQLQVDGQMSLTVLVACLAACSLGRGGRRRRRRHRRRHKKLIFRACGYYEGAIVCSSVCTVNRPLQMQTLSS